MSLFFSLAIFIYIYFLSMKSFTFITYANHNKFRKCSSNNSKQQKIAIEQRESQKNIIFINLSITVRVCVKWQKMFEGCEKCNLMIFFHTPYQKKKRKKKENSKRRLRDDVSSLIMAYMPLRRKGRE